MRAVLAVGQEHTAPPAVAARKPVHTAEVLALWTVAALVNVCAHTPVWTAVGGRGNVVPRQDIKRPCIASASPGSGLHAVLTVDAKGEQRDHDGHGVPPTARRHGHRRYGCAGS